MRKKCAICWVDSLEIFGMVESSAWVSTKAKNLKRKRIKFRLAKCRNCGHVMIPDELSSEQITYLYKPNSKIYSPHVISSTKRINSNIINFSMEFMREKNPLVLDFGCGDLTFLNILEKRVKGRFFGVDFSFNSPKSKSNINYIKADITKISKVKKLAKINFDYGFLVHTLEHLRYPRTFLENLKPKMKDNTFLYIEVPANELLKKIDLLGLTLIHPQHLQYFTLDTLSLLVNLSGFLILKSNVKITEGIPRIQMIISKRNLESNCQQILRAQEKLLSILLKTSRTISSTIKESKTLALWGIGDDLEKMIRNNKELGKLITGKDIVFIDTYLAGKNWLGKKIFDPHYVASSKTPIIITVLAEHMRKDIITTSRLKGVNPNRIIDPFKGVNRY